jgi:hypothetical protein
MSGRHSLAANSIAELAGGATSPHFCRQYRAEELDLDDFAEAIRQLLHEPGQRTVASPTIRGK